METLDKQLIHAIHGEYFKVQRNPSYTKKGPGRRHVENKAKQYDRIANQNPSSSTKVQQS